MKQIKRYKMNTTQKSADGFILYPMPETLDGYCCIDGDTLWLSSIWSKDEGKGNFRKFLDKVEGEFKVIKVPTPSNRMRMILTKRGYISTKEYFAKVDCFGEVMMLTRDVL